MRPVNLPQVLDEIRHLTKVTNGFVVYNAGKPTPEPAVVKQRQMEGIIMQAFGETENSSFRPHIGQTTKEIRQVRRGERIFNSRQHIPRVYTVVKGEVLILRRGLLVDLVGPGEFLDTRFWPGANAVAWTDCRLMIADH